MAKIKPVKVALVGSGDISGIYLYNLKNTFSAVDIVGCSDIISQRSKQRAEEFSIRQMTNEEIFSDPEIEIVLNTTYPKAHYEVTKQALLSGKHVYSEKMMSVTMQEADELMALAKKNGLRLAIAPDTFLGAPIQTCRKMIEDGFIGTPIHADALVIRGYRPTGEECESIPAVMDAGGGMPFDMGGYYIHAMLNMLGGFSRVSGFAKTNNPIDHYENPKNPMYKEPFDFLSENMLVGSLEFKSGCYGTLTAMSEGCGETTRLEIYGTKGRITCGDPNNFDSEVFLTLVDERGEMGEKMKMPFTHGYSKNSRGIAVADMAWAIRNNRPHRCSAELGYHAFEAIHGIISCCKSGSVYKMKSDFTPEKPLPAGFIPQSISEASLDN